MSSMLLGVDPLYIILYHNTFGLISMPLNQVMVENQHNRWLPCVWGIDRILLILGFIFDQLSQFFFPLAPAALDLQVVQICRRMSFTCSLRVLLLYVSSCRLVEYLPWPNPACTTSNRNLSKCLDTDGILLHLVETDFFLKKQTKQNSPNCVFLRSCQ